MRIGKVDVTFHRTVRVMDGRTPANLPPSLGRAKVSKVSQYQANCPEGWDPSGVFIPLHDTEALWLQFSPSAPSAIIVGAGGINAVDGLALGTKLVNPQNYLVCPPQPWLDGWKGQDDGSIYQFVATPYQKGEGLSVGEQILGAESKTGGMGIAVFDSVKELAPVKSPREGYSGSAYGSLFEYPYSYEWPGAKGMSLSAAPSVMRGSGVPRGAEMGIGMGGKIAQKIYPDPYGIEVWKESPAEIAVVYLIDAAGYEEITGISIPKPASQGGYGGKWYGLDDEGEGDTPGSTAFDKLKSVFPGDTENVG